MAERYQPRNVAEKEIYDSYMGIIRISPNEINGKDLDDPTKILNTLFDEQNKERTKIIVSDSDGNPLPFIFRTRAYQETILRRDTTSLVDTKNDVDLIHVTTIAGKNWGTKGEGIKEPKHPAQGRVFVSNEMKVRSTLVVYNDLNDDLPEQNASQYRHSNFRILSEGEVSSSYNRTNGEGWLLYPTESPNDPKYFNDKNFYKLFDPNDSKPRHKQVEDNLYKWTREEHEKINKNERVVAGGRYVTRINAYNEEIPIYQTHDYILGHYDGHQLTKNNKGDNAAADRWGTSQDECDAEYITKLSWTRIDNLIWDSINEILKGRVRHTRGRYNELGKSESAYPGLIEALNLTKIEDQGVYDNNLYKEYAPLLGTEVQRGLICYNAMPFHRYWFHRCRQALRAFIERRKIDLGDVVKNLPEGTNLDEFVASFGLLGDGYKTAIENVNHRIELETLEHYFTNGRLTPCTMGTVGFANSLAKNFLLCDGQEVTFANYPNISLTNEIIFDTTGEGDNEVRGVRGLIAQFNTDTRSFVERGKYVNTVVASLAISTNDMREDEPLSSKETPPTDYNDTPDTNEVSTTKRVKLPQLFALWERAPRFIRGLNWRYKREQGLVYPQKTDDGEFENKDGSVTVRMWKIGENKSYYVANLEEESDFDPDQDPSLYSKFGRPQTLKYDQVDFDGEENKQKNYSRINKYFTNTSKVRFHTFDHLIEKERHYHYMFSSETGQSEGYDPDTNTSMSYNQFLLGQYHCENTRGGHCLEVYYNHYLGFMNFDRFYTKPYLVKNRRMFRFNTNEGKWDDNGDYLDYCLNRVYTNKGFYCSFQPVPNIGLVLFNSSIFNAEGDSSMGSYRGTSYKIENKQGSYYYIDAEDKKHIIADEAPISPTNPSVEYVTTEELKKHDAEKARRKFLAMKLNEAEGFIPISYQGKAGGTVTLAWSRAERRGLKARTRNTYHDWKKNVASYIMGSMNNNAQVKAYNDTVAVGNGYWRCVTSIPYVNPMKLGVGDVKNYINNRKNYNEDVDYYDVNCVTQLPKHDKNRTFSFGGVSVEIDESCPSPNYLNLLPLIRI